jgi:hypothetical protein
MTKSARDFYDVVVRHACDDHLSYPLSLRHAMMAAIALHHLVDYRALETYSGPDNSSEMRAAVKVLRDALTARCNELLIIGDIADASKHSRLTTPKSGPRFVQDILQLEASKGIFHAPFGQGVFNEASYIFVRLPDGTKTPFSHLLTTVQSMWKRELGI